MPTQIRADFYADWALRLGGSKRYMPILRRMIQGLKQMPPVPLRNFTDTAIGCHFVLTKPLLRKLETYAKARDMAYPDVVRQAVNAGLYTLPIVPPLLRAPNGKRQTEIHLNLSPRQVFVLNQELARPANFGWSISDLLRRAVANLPTIEPPQDTAVKNVCMKFSEAEFENASRVAQAMELTNSDLLRSFAWLAVTSNEGMDPVKRYLLRWLSKPLQTLIPRPLSAQEAEEWR